MSQKIFCPKTISNEELWSLAHIHLWNNKLSAENGSGLDILFEKVPQP
jgi:hypothetical protein